MTTALTKYLTIFSLSWQNGLVYRVNLILWRIRQLLATLMALTVWNVAFAQSTTLFGYDRSQITTYILIISILQSVVLATSLHGLAGEIYSGNLSTNLLKPVKLFALFTTLELADKLRNFLFSIGEALALWLLFKPQISLPEPSILALFLFWVVLGVVIHFYITILFGALGFWSPETWAPKFLFFIAVDFTAGKLFPLDILPESIQRLLFLTPFPYFSYAQAQLFLGRLNCEQIITMTSALIAWCAISALTVHLVWQKGIKSYASAGH
jgi:ABC-2 type transport system permease protein